MYSEDGNNDSPVYPSCDVKQSIAKDLPVLVTSTQTHMSGSETDGNHKSIITTNGLKVKEEQVSGNNKDSKIQHISNSAQQHTKEGGSNKGNFDKTDDTFVVNLFEQSNDGKDRAYRSEVDDFDSEDETSIINNLAKKYGEDNIFDNSDEEAIAGSFCYEDGPLCPN